MRLTIIHGSEPRKGERQILEDKDVVRIGRDQDNDVVFDSPEHRAVSGCHAEILMADGKVSVSDKGSTNGLIVGGRRVTGADLSPGDTVQLGENGPLFVVEFSTPTVAAPIRDAGPAGSESAGAKKYGERTVGVMIQQALAQAGLLVKTGTSKSTEYFEALVDSKVRGTGSRVKRLLVISTAVILLASAGVGYYIYRNRSVQVFQTTEINYGDATGRSIAAENRYTVFMLAGQAEGSDALRGFCTAFAVSQNVLATNAHCIQTADEQFPRLMALMNGAPANRYEIVRKAAHPGYQAGTISPDVGLLMINGYTTSTVTIAPPAELGRVAPGEPVFLYGFPGRLNKEEAPEATFIRGEIGRVTTFDQKLGDLGENTLLQHSAFSSSGTSGSPMFNSKGHVIGINAGGYAEEGRVLAGYNFGMRIDLVYSLFPMLQGK